MRRQKGHPPVVYFVDDNFIGNRKAAKDMLPHLVAWQKQHGYPLQFACEATLNIAKQPEILALMREASFLGLFVGIETPEADALKAMRKDQNNAVPMMASIKTLNDYGLEVTSGIILGLDTDTDDTESRLKDFIDVSQIPMLTINLLQALPKTPLWDRLTKTERIADDPTLESNVRFLRPYDEVVAMWRRCIAYANDPERLFARFHHQVDPTYVNRHDPAGARQAQLGQPVGRAGAGVQRDAAHRHPVGLSQAVLARGAPRHAPRPDRRGARHGLHRASPDPVHPRSAARRAERVVLLDQIARAGRAGAVVGRGAAAVAQVGLSRRNALGALPPPERGRVGVGVAKTKRGSRDNAREPSAPPISPSGNGCRRMAGGLAQRRCASLSVTPDHDHRAVCRRAGRSTRSGASWPSACGVSLGQPVIIENVAGASGTLALGRVARAPPDGYTISHGSTPTHVFNGAIFQAAVRRTEDDFQPISPIANGPLLIVARKAIADVT